MRIVSLLIVFAWMCLPANISLAALRVATYNVFNNPDNTSEDNSMRSVFQGIANQSVNGIAKPIDIITLHEIDTAGTNRIPNLLFNVNPSGNYQIAATASVGGDKNAIAYDANKVSLVGSGMVTLNNPSGVRDILRAQFRPVGYSSSDADFYVYSQHYKAGSSSSSQRSAEAAYVRADADLLGDANIIYSGDFNFYSTGEAGYQQITSSGNGQGYDPVVSLGYQTSGTTSVTYPSSGRRFDYQFITGELDDNEGIDIIPGNYRVYYGSGDNISDHRPVVVDYQIPAVMDAVLGSFATSYTLGQAAQVMLSVENIADVVGALGADELDYSISVSGDLLGSYIDTDLALGGGNSHSILLDTSTAGLKSGVITVESSSLSVENSLFTFPVSFEVESIEDADFNSDNLIDGNDFLTWQRGYGMGSTLAEGDANGDGLVNDADLTVWRSQYGLTVSTAATVPEPSTTVLLVLGSLGVVSAARFTR